MKSSTEAFRHLHLAGEFPLILPNAWDAAGARLVESLGGKAVATTSAGVAWSLGYPDGNRLPIDKLTHLVRSIVESVKVPVTVDVEGGYSDDATTVAERLRPIFEAGIAGINIEDGSDAPDVLARKVRAIKQMTSALGLDVFVNVRTDVYLRNLAADGQKVAETLKRAAAYQSAGADGLFVPGLASPDDISNVCNGTRLPVNVMAVGGLPPAKTLAALGVRRLSSGSALAQSIWQRFAELSQRFLADGESTTVVEHAMGYGQMQALFAPTR